VAYTVFWALGGLLAMQIRFIGGNHLTSHELLSFNMVWLGLQVGTAEVDWWRGLVVWTASLCVPASLCVVQCEGLSRVV
jgi:hypothetical protein